MDTNDKTIESIRRRLEYPDGPSGCWIFTGPKRRGYGAIANRSFGTAHRAMYVAMCGAIPTGLQLDHLCRNRACCNPDHLEPVTQRENLRRGNGATGKNARKTQCPRGHPYDKANTYWHVDKRSGHACRGCRACRYARATAQPKHPRPPRTHCNRGHAWIPENMYAPPGRGPQCRLCSNAAGRRWHSREKANRED